MGERTDAVSREADVLPLQVVIRLVVLEAALLLLLDGQQLLLLLLLIPLIKETVAWI
jgi:hypothetical protein